MEVSCGGRNWNRTFRRQFSLWIFIVNDQIYPIAVSKCALPPPYWKDFAALLPAQVLYFSPRMHPQPPTWQSFYLSRFSGTTGSCSGTTCHKTRYRVHRNLLSAAVSGLKSHFPCKNKLLSNLIHIPNNGRAVVFLLSIIHGGREGLPTWHLTACDSLIKQLLLKKIGFPAVFFCFLTVFFFFFVPALHFCCYHDWFPFCALMCLL